jgi:hypothetical protein
MAIEPEDIEELGTAPKKIVGDEGSVEERPIKELVEADRYAAGKRATGPPYGMRISKIEKPGTP